MASVVPGARVAASCCAARFAATTAVDIVATAATLGEIIADGLCMLLASHVQRFALTGHFVSQQHILTSVALPPPASRRLPSTYPIPSSTYVLQGQWTGSCELMDVHYRL